MNDRTTGGDASRYGRRDALKLGGLTISAAALVAACGTDRTGDDTPGRVGYAPPITDPPDYSVDDAVLLRTASSLELTAIAVYEAILDTGALDDDLTTLVERLIENHQAIADEMGQLTESVGGVAWECTNEWYMDRTITPILEAVAGSDDPLRDILNTAVALENIAAATHQTLTIDLEDADASAATMAAATLESRHSAAIVAAARGPEGYVSPAITGGDIADRSRRPSVRVLDHQSLRVHRSERTRGRRSERGRRPPVVHPADTRTELLRLQRTRTHLLTPTSGTGRPGGA
jgi:hypothetical protein